MTPAEQIRAVRHSTGLSQAAFSNAYEIPRRTLQDWEAGRRIPPVYVLKMLDLIVRSYPPENMEAPE